MTILGHNVTFNTILGKVSRMFLRRIDRFETVSPLSGRIVVYDRGRERVLEMDGQVHSVYFRGPGWGEAKRDYWGRMASTPFGTPAGANVLMLGLGGGTTLHLIAGAIRPSGLTVVERDPIVIGIAREWFGVGEIPGVRIVEGDALESLARMEAGPERFDLIIDDVFFTETSALSGAGKKLHAALRTLLRPGGSVVLNRPVDSPRDAELHRAYADELRSAGNEVIVRTVRGSGHNDIMYLRPNRT